PHVLTEVDAQQPGIGQFTPQVAVDRALAAGLGLDLLQPLVRRTLTKDLRRQLADGLLLFTEIEVHGCSRSRGRPDSAQRPRHAEAEDRDEVTLDLVGTASE